MQPAQHDIDIYRGDDCAVVFRLWSRQPDGTRVPLPVTGSTFELAVAGGPVRSSANGGLTVTATTGTAEVRWSATAAETAAIRPGRLTPYAFVRFDSTRGRRTYLTGYIAGRQAPDPGGGDTAFDLTIDDGTVVVELTVDDASAALAVEAAVAAVTAQFGALFETMLAGLPTSLPSEAGKPWNNGNLLSIS